MMDKIIYCSDLISLKAKLATDGYYDEVSGVYYIPNQTRTPIKHNGNQTLCYTRGHALDLTVYTMLEDLGTYDSIILAENVANLDKYKSVYDYTVLQSNTDENGIAYTYTLPFKIGEFA